VRNNTVNYCLEHCIGCSERLLLEERLRRRRW